MHALVLAAALEGSPVDATLVRAREAEEAMRFAEALAAYAAVADEVPEARARARWLEARRDAEFGPLRALEAVRRSATRAASPADIDALAGEAEAFPPGLVRAEARLFAATAYLGRLDQPARGRAILRLVGRDDAATEFVRRQAIGALVRASIEDGRVLEARRDARLFGDRVPPDARALLEARLRRLAATVAAIAALLGVAGGLGGALVRAPRPRPAPGAVLPTPRPRLAAALRRRDVLLAAAGCAVIALGGVLAAAYDGSPRTAAPFAALALALAPLVLAARAWSALGARTRSARVGRALACAAAALGLALLVLDRVDPSYLEGFGL